MAIGEKLRGEREARNITIDQISAATGIGRSYLEDLERDALRALPGRAKFYIRAYAQTLGFDPQRMIDQYDRELEAKRTAPAAPAETERAAPRPVEAAIARWRKAAMAAHSAPAPDSTDDFEDDEELDDEPYDDGGFEEEAAVAPVTLPSPRLMEAIAGGGDPDEQVEGSVIAIEQSEAEASSPHVLQPIQPEPPVVAAQVAPPTVPAPVRVEREVTSPATVYSPAAEWRSAPVPPKSRARVAASILVGIVVLFAGIRMVFFKTNADGGSPAPVAAAPALSSPAPKPPRSEPEPQKTLPEAPKRTAALQVIVKPSEDPAPAEVLTVIASGVGRKIVNHRLAETAGTFAPGDVAWFSTRVTGGRAGQGIRHVWIHEGRPQQSIPLTLAGPDYHTHSRKTIWYEGTWTVEARDGQGEVLASANFECIRPH